MNAYVLSLNPEANAADQWDFALVEDLITWKLWKPYNAPEVELKNVTSLPNGDVAIVVVPARHHKGLEEELNRELDKLNRAVVFLIGDEEADFDVTKIDTDNRHIWVQNPHPGKHDKYHKLGTGYPPQLREHLGFTSKDLSLYFSGQLTHNRRMELWNNLMEYFLHDTNIEIQRTQGFTQGVAHETYYQFMKRAKVAPAPSGAVIPDSFRLFEALECMAIPLADEVNPTQTITHYWNWLFDEETPFPKVTAWDMLVGLTQETVADWPHNMHYQTAWWIGKKREWAYKLAEQLDEL